MGSLFGSPKLPAPAPAPEAPKIDDAAVQAAADEERRKRGSTGRASTIFTDPSGDEPERPSARKVLGVL